MQNNNPNAISTRLPKIGDTIAVTYGSDGEGKLEERTVEAATITVVYLDGSVRVGDDVYKVESNKQKKIDAIWQTKKPPRKAWQK